MNTPKTQETHQAGTPRPSAPGIRHTQPAPSRRLRTALRVGLGLLSASLVFALHPGVPQAAELERPKLKKAPPPPPRTPQPKATPKPSSPVFPGDHAQLVLLTHATLHVGDGTVIEDATLAMQNGVITQVAASAPSTPGADVHDLRGKLVTPGLIAADTQLGLVEISLEDSTRDDSRRDGQAIRAGYDPASAINAESSLIPIQAIEGVTTAAVAPSGALISGQITWIDLLAGEHTKLVAAPEIAVSANLGRAHHGSRAASLAELRRAFEDARWYRDNQRSYDRGAARELAAHPLDLRALWPLLAGEVPLVVHADRASDLLALLELQAEFELRLTIVGGTEAWKVRDQLAAAEVVVVVQPTQNLPSSFDRLGARLDNAALLDAAGVPVAIAHFDTHNARNLTQEAGIAVANGLDPAAALRAITYNVALAYGMEDRYGTIAVDKVANVVVWDGDDPFELSTWPEQVWIRGRAIEMRSRQTQLRDRYMNLDTFPE